MPPHRLPGGHVVAGDKFVVTPDAGLCDFSLAASTRWKKASLGLAFHDYEADDGGADYGVEWNFVVKYPLLESIDLGLKFAHYDAKDFDTDTEKLWVWATFTP